MGQIYKKMKRQQNLIYSAAKFCDFTDKLKGKSIPNLPISINCRNFVKLIDCTINKRLSKTF